MSDCPSVFTSQLCFALFYFPRAQSQKYEQRYRAVENELRHLVAMRGEEINFYWCILISLGGVSPEYCMLLGSKKVFPTLEVLSHEATCRHDLSL